MEKEYQISKNAFRELYYFCLRYNEFEKQIEILEKAGGNNDFSRISNKTNAMIDTTGDTAIRIANIRAKIELIEKVLADVCIDYAEYNLYSAMLVNVTNKIPYEQWILEQKLKNIKAKTIGINKFRILRRKFYYLLAIRKDLI